jgi:NAD(P)-dependent dehydrogenase (short-subunit alcohol dehydrogenase family)
VPSLKDQVAIITGAGSGIGRGGALRFASEGAHVVVADIKSADTVAEEIRQRRGNAIGIEVDVADPAAVDAMVQRVVDKFGKIDILWSNAGVQVNKPVETTTDAEFERVMKVNFGGFFHCVRAVVPHMIKQRSGAILSTSSIDGVIGERNIAVYSGSKGAILAMTRAMTADYAQYGIRVNSLCPGWIDTPINDPFFLNNPAAKALATSYQPIGRLGTPADIAGVAAFLCSADAGFVTGATIVVDGGITSTWLETPPETPSPAQ